MTGQYCRILGQVFSSSRAKLLYMHCVVLCGKGRLVLVMTLVKNVVMFLGIYFTQLARKLSDTQGRSEITVTV